MKSGYKNSEVRDLIRSGEISRELGDCVTINVRVRPSQGYLCKEAALSILMALTLRSRRRPDGPARQAIVEGGGWIFDLEPASGRFKLVLSERNFPVPNDLSHVLTLALSPVEYSYTEEYWIEGIELPQRLKASLKGPRLGVSGIRQLFKSAPPSKPLLGFTLSSPEHTWSESSRMLQAAIKGGVDFVADDLFDLVGADSRSALKRAEETLAAIEGSREGDAVPYFANLSAYSLMKADLVDQLLALGVKGFIVNPFVVGWDFAAEFSACVAGRGVIIHSNMGSGVLSRQPDMNPTASGLRSGMHEAVISMLSRATGADAVHAGTVGAECFDKDWDAPIEALMTPSTQFQPCFRVAEGDITPVNYFANLSRLGSDLLIEANSAIFGHPKGPRAGASAFRRTIDILHEDIDDPREARELLVRDRDDDLRHALRHFADGQEGTA